MRSSYTLLCRGLSFYFDQFTEGMSPWRSEAGHSPQATAQVKKIWIYTSTPPYAFMA
jgi:hypothetical protein